MFQVATGSHYVVKNNVTIPAVVMSHDESLKEVLVLDVACSVRQIGDDDEQASVADHVNNCSVAVDSDNGSLSLFIPGSNLLPGRYNVQIKVLQILHFATSIVFISIGM